MAQQLNILTTPGSNSLYIPLAAGKRVKVLREGLYQYQYTPGGDVLVLSSGNLIFSTPFGTERVTIIIF